MSFNTDTQQTNSDFAMKCLPYAYYYYHYYIIPKRQIQATEFIIINKQYPLFQFCFIVFYCLRFENLNSKNDS